MAMLDFPRDLLRVALRLQRWVLCAALVLCCSSLSAGAQSQSGEPSPQVLRLYAQAQAAQRQGNAPDAIEKYKAILKVAPRLAAAYNNLGLLYYNQNNYQAAIPVLQEGLRIAPKMTASWALLGTCQFAIGQDVEAQQSLRNALRGNPKDDQVQMLLARVLIRAGHEKEAVSVLEKLVAQNPNHQEAWYLLGQTYLQLSQGALAKVQQINPNSVLSHVISGEIMESMKNYGGALIEFKKAVAINPRDGGAQEHLANVYWELGEWDTARKAFQTELSYSPQSCSAQWKAADCLVKQHLTPDESLKELDQVIAQCNLMQARVDRARVLIDTGKRDEALPDLLAAEKESPDEPSIHFLLAQVYRSEHLSAKAGQELALYSQLQQAASEKVAERAAEIQKLKADPQ